MENKPTVSIVIPARNASKYLKSCLSSIEKLNYPKDRLEIIVANNGSTDETVSIARRWGACVVDAAELRVGGVRNRGARVANGSIIAFTDSDILVGSTWISSAVERLKDEKVGAVGGACRSPENGTWVEKAWTTRAVNKNVRCLAGSSLILRREIFERLGGFNEQLVAAEDDDLSHRIGQMKLQLCRVPNCDVTHLGYPKTLFDVARRQVWLGSSIDLDIRKIRDPMTFLAYFFLVALASLAPAILIAMKFHQYFLVNLLVLIGIPIVVAASKALKGSEYYTKPKHFAQLWVIFIYYFCGKSFGILGRVYNVCRNG